MWQIVLYLVISATPPTFEVQTLDGRTILGSLAGLTADRLIVETDEGRVSLEMEKLLGLTRREKPIAQASAPGAWIELVDGSMIVAAQYTAEGEQARITLPDGQLIETPARSIRTVRLQADWQPVADQWTGILAKKHDGDVIVVRKGDNLDYHQGVLRDVSDEVVQFQLDGEVLPIKRDKIYGFAYRHAAGEALPGPICRLTDTFGSLWQVSKITLDDKLSWVTPTGLMLSKSPDIVAQIDFSQGKVVYLSDLKPESITWTPLFGMAKILSSWQQFYAPRQDRNFESNPLQLAGTEYGKGLAFHSRTEMVYRLPASYSRLKAVAGIDDSVRPHGNVRLVLRGDDKVLLDTPITGSDEPKSIDLDITGVRRLSILVDFGAQMDFGDNLDLCNARITK